MVLTKKNVEAAIEISNILAEKECTIADLPGIFSYVGMKINKNTIVQKVDYSKVYESALKESEED